MESGKRWAGGFRSPARAVEEKKSPISLLEYPLRGPDFTGGIPSETGCFVHVLSHSCSLRALSVHVCVDVQPGVRKGGKGKGEEDVDSIAFELSRIEEPTRVLAVGCLWKKTMAPGDCVVGSLALAGLAEMKSTSPIPV